MEQATEDELSHACARADRTGLFTCPHTGVALAALFKLVDRNIIKRDDKVIVISTAHGLKFPDFKVNYHENQLQDFGVIPALKNRPIEAGEKYEEVRDAVLSALDKVQEAYQV